MRQIVEGLRIPRGVDGFWIDRTTVTTMKNTHHRQVGLELIDRFAELGDLGALVVEEKVVVAFPGL